MNREGSASAVVTDDSADNRDGGGKWQVASGNKHLNTVTVDWAVSNEQIRENT